MLTCLQAEPIASKVRSPLKNPLFASDEITLFLSRYSAPFGTGDSRAILVNDYSLQFTCACPALRLLRRGERSPPSDRYLLNQSDSSRFEQDSPRLHSMLPRFARSLYMSGDGLKSVVQYGSSESSYSISFCRAVRLLAYPDSPRRASEP